MADISAFGRRSVVARVDQGGQLVLQPVSTLSDQGFSPADEKYDVEASIGQGGMGEVLLVQDRDLQRQVAMKVLREEMAGDVAHRLRFVAEAQATSQLEHPGIPPVHDIGISPTGRVYFTMKLVRGRTLAEVLKDLLLGVRPVRKEYTLHKLVSILERMAEALHFAHEKGVIHRDLKPENIMLGDFGEVHVMDWGIAKVSAEEDEFEDEFGDPESITTTGTDVLKTQVGTIKGTIPYMSPEQAHGAGDLDRLSDIYALGCLLYEMLTLHAAFEGNGVQLLLRVRKGDFPAVETRNAKRPPPVPLAGLCTRAMALERADRPETARAFGDELRNWLDGRAERARRHAQAEGFAKQGIASLRRYESLRTEADEAEKKAESMKRNFKPWQSVDEKDPWLAAREAVTDMRREMSIAFADATALLNAALAAEAENATATRALGDLWAKRLAETELQGAADDAAHALAMLTRYDDGRYAGLIEGDGSLELVSDPPGAEVTLHRFESRRGVLHEREGRSLGTTPVDSLTLPMGSYLCILRKDGYRDVRYPVHITRGRAWKGTVRMRNEQEIGEDFVYVPGGPFVYGEGKDTTTKELPDFLIQKTPVTFGHWSEFLAAVEVEEGVEAAATLIPSVKGDGNYMERCEGGTYRARPNNIEGPARERCIAEFGDNVDDLLPLAGVSWHDANAYCAWKTRTTGREWRLPTEEEREKAARGVDGRRFPWGDLADPSLCKNRDSRNEAAQPEPVGTFPTAVSVYGMIDAAGNSWDWTSSLFEPHVKASTSRVVRGGSWVSPVDIARSANRGRYAPEYRGTFVGFRPASSVTT